MKLYWVPVAKSVLVLQILTVVAASVFEIENSPNIGMKGIPHGSTLGVWPVPNPCGYAQLLKLTYPAVKALTPNATVLVGGIGGNKDLPGLRMAADEFLAGVYGPAANANK